MPSATLISDEVRTVEATISDGRLLVAPERLAEAIGWELKPQGLCRDDVCVPVRDPESLFVGKDLDLEAVADALGRMAVVDADGGIAAVAMDPGGRHGALDSLRAPSFVLDDLDGRPHRLEEWRGRKKLLVAFASW
jgi:hypothetical protein